MDRVADLAAGESALPGDPAGAVRRAHAGEPLGVEAVRAALEERERAVRQAADALERRRARPARAAAAQARQAAPGAPGASNSVSCASAAARRRGSCSAPGANRSTREPEPRLAPDELAVLERPRRRAGASTQPIGVRASRRSGIDRAGDDQPVDRARHRDVVEAHPLGLLGVVLRLAHRLVLERGHALAARRIDDLEAEPAVRKADDLLAARARPLPAGVGDDHDLELEPLRGVDRQQPDGPRSLLLRDRLELLDAGGVLLEHEAHEALDVGPAQLLERTGEPRQLAQVRVPAAPVPLGEHGEVVVVLDEDLLAEPLQPDRPAAAPPAGRSAGGTPGRGARRARSAPRAAPVSSPVKSGRRGAARRRRTSASFETPTNGRGEHGDERLVVVAVVQEPQVGEQVDDLLLAEVAAARRPVGRQAGGAQLLLVDLGVGAGGEEEDDLARLGLAGVDDLARPGVRRPSPRLAASDAGVPVARLVGDEQLDRRARRRDPGTGRRRPAAGTRRRTSPRRGG